MSAMRQPRTFTFDEYLLIERDSIFRSDYIDGTIYAMSGGTLEHAAIASNVVTALNNRLQNSGCKAVGSDLMVATEDQSFSAYPDVVVYCRDLQFLGNRRDILLNPRLIVEVLSPSTESYDRGEKFERYRRIASLQAYLLISQDRPLVELWSRGEEEWTCSITEGISASVSLPALGIALPLAEAYEGILPDQA